jgi:hypothetical protein
MSAGGHDLASSAAVGGDPDDPARRTPTQHRVLLRTIAVLALALPAVLLLGLVVPGQTPFVWLLPAVGFVAVVLAASTWVSPLNAATTISAAWLLAVWLVMRAYSPTVVLGARIQVAFLVLAAASFFIGFPRGFTAFAFVDYFALLKEWAEPAVRHAEVRRVPRFSGRRGWIGRRVAWRPTYCCCVPIQRSTRLARTGNGSDPEPRTVSWKDRMSNRSASRRSASARIRWISSRPTM